LEHPLASCQAQQRFLPPNSISPGAGGHSQKPLTCLQLDGEEALAISWQAWPPCGTSSQVSLPRSRKSRVPALGSGRNFPLGMLALLPMGFLPFSAPLSMTTCPSSSTPSGLHSCLLLLHHQDGLLCAATGGRKAFFPPLWANTALHGLFALLCSTRHRPLPGLLSALSHCRLPAVLAPPRHHSCPGSLSLSCPSLPKQHSAALLQGQK